MKRHFVFLATIVMAAAFSATNSFAATALPSYHGTTVSTGAIASIPAGNTTLTAIANNQWRGNVLFAPGLPAGDYDLTFMYQPIAGKFYQTISSVCKFTVVAGKASGCSGVVQGLSATELPNVKTFVVYSSTLHANVASATEVPDITHFHGVPTSSDPAHPVVGNTVMDRVANNQWQAGALFKSGLPAGDYIVRLVYETATPDGMSYHIYDGCTFTVASGTGGGCTGVFQKLTAAQLPGQKTLLIYRIGGGFSASAIEVQ